MSDKASKVFFLKGFFSSFSTSLTVVLRAEAVEGGAEDVDEVPLRAQEGKERVVVGVEVVAWVEGRGEDGEEKESEFFF